MMINNIIFTKLFFLFLTISNINLSGGVDGTRTRDLRRDRPAL